MNAADKRAVEQFAIDALISLFDRHQTGQTQVFLADIWDDMKDRFGHTEGDLLGCLFAMALAGFVEGGVELVWEDSLNEGTSKGIGHRWFALTRNGELEALKIREEARSQKLHAESLLVGGRRKKKERLPRRLLQLLYDSLEIKPGAWGVKLDVKKVLDATLKKKA